MATKRVTRKDFTDRLGLPSDATNDQFFAALDARLAKAPARPRQTADDAAYSAVYGLGDGTAERYPAASAAATAAYEDALWQAVMGE
jgi:hypothetical protein